MDANDRWSPSVWRSDHLGNRLTFGLTCFSRLCADAPAEFRARFSLYLTRQARHLFRLSAPDWSEADTFAMRRGAVFAALFLAPFRRRLASVMDNLLEDVRDQVFPDGGHISRHPEKHLEAMMALVHIRSALNETQTEVPEFLQVAIDRMAPMLRAYCLGDHGLASFNGASVGNISAIKKTLELSGSRAKSAASAPHTGFHRLSNQRTTVLFDAGPPVQGAPRVPGHAGTLSFEMSVGANRLIVNCGNIASDPGNDLFEALRATAAHSTLTIANTHSSDLESGSGFGPRRVRSVNVRRREQDRNVLVEASHEGYSDVFGIVHRRSLYLARSGLDLRGEDILEADTSTGRPFDIRFHLHPSVRVSLVEGGKSALLKLPTGRGWRLTVSDGTVLLEDSLYASEGPVTASKQVVINGRHTRRRTVTKWRLAREG